MNNFRNQGPNDNFFKSLPIFKKAIFYGAITLFCFSCANALKSEKVVVTKEVLPYTVEVIKEVELLYFTDQKNRRLSSLVENASKAICDTTNAGRKIKQNLSAVDDMIGFYLYELEDTQNIAKLIEITKKHGFPTLQDSIHKVPAYIIFMHTDKSQIDEVREIVLKEYEQGRMLTFEKDKILWSLDGRPFGKMPQADRDVLYYSDKDVFDYLTNVGKEKQLKELKRQRELKQFP